MRVSRAAVWPTVAAVWLAGISGLHTWYRLCYNRPFPAAGLGQRSFLLLSQPALLWPQIRLLKENRRPPLSPPHSRPLSLPRSPFLPHPASVSPSPSLTPSVPLSLSLAPPSPSDSPSCDASNLLLWVQILLFYSTPTQNGCREIPAETTHSELCRGKKNISGERSRPSLEPVTGGWILNIIVKLRSYGL